MCFLFPIVSWFNHIKQQLSPKHLLTQSSQWGWEDNEKVKMRKLVGTDKGSLVSKARAVHASRTNEEFTHHSLWASRCSAISKKAALYHV